MRLRFLFLAALVELLASPAVAEKSYMLQVDSSQAAAIAARYGCQTVRTDVVGGRSKALMKCDLPLSDQALSALKLEPAVSAVDDDQDTQVPEVPPGPPAQRSTAPASIPALQDVLSKSAATAFFGSTVRLAYISQAATTLIANDFAHQNYATGTGALVAVIDTGVDPNHPALKNALVPGYDFTRDVPGTPSEWLDLQPSATATALAQSTVAILDQKNTPAILNQSTVAILDQSTVAILDATQVPAAFGHGTMVAGLIHLVAPNAKIMPLKAFRADGSSDLYQIIRAIYYAVDHDAEVINMSFSLAQGSTELAAAISYASSHGVVCIASAGNTGQQVVVYPAAYSGVFGVGSTNNSDVRSTFSNYGSSAFTSAPGEAVITTYPGNNYAGVWGTSFSAGLVSGGVSLLVGKYPSISLSGVANALNHGQPIGQGMGQARLHLVKMFNN